MTEIAEATLLSAATAGWATLFCLPLALLAASLLYGSRWRALEALFLVPLLLSPTVSGFLLLWLLSPNHPLGRLIRRIAGQLVFTPSGTVLACLLVSFPLAFQACMIGRSRVAPSLKESSQVLGATPLFTTVTVVWPQMAGAIVMAALLVVARSLGEFGASMMVGGNIPGRTQTLPLLIYSLAEEQHLGSAAIAAVVSAVLGMLAYLALRQVARALGETAARP
jgi:molybdate transport system permease protein